MRTSVVVTLCSLLIGLLASGWSGNDIPRLVNFDPINVDRDNHASRSSYAESGGIQLSNSKGLRDFAPIKNTITQSDTQYYSFAVNTTIGLGAYYQLLIFLTGNICQQPNNIQQSDPGIAVYYSFNSSMVDDLSFAKMVLFEGGYFQGLADVPVTPAGSPEKNDTTLYIAVRAPQNTNNTAEWSYQLGVSQNDLVFQWDNRDWAQVVDTDDSSVLIVTGNLTVDIANITAETVALLDVNKSQYSLYLYPYDQKDYFSSLNMSWCAIRNGPALTHLENNETTYTFRNGILQQQFYVTGLNDSTKYIGYLLTDFKGDGSSGGAVYQQFEFETLEAPACELIYNLDFCDMIAYLVPASLNMSKNDVQTLYDNQAKDLYGNFSKALQQIACDTVDDAIFSPVTLCLNCASSYKDWLCSVTIPRCTTRNVTGSLLRRVNESRNDFINEVTSPTYPYYEVLPCINICQAIARDCPADFGFLCPTTNETIQLSYYWDVPGEQYATCNYVGRWLAKLSDALRVTKSVVWVIAVVVLFI